MSGSLACVFCLSGGAIAPHQILLKGRYFYLCVPLGQIVEGFLIIAPKSCRSETTGYQCLGDAPERALDELVELMGLVESFFRNQLGADQITFYEQGRAGGGATMDASERFRHHAHLCCLPCDSGLPQHLAGRFAVQEIGNVYQLSVFLDSVGRQPYVYVRDVSSASPTRELVYTANEPAGRAILERIRLKEAIAHNIGCPEKANWRNYPGETEIARVPVKFHSFWGGHHAAR